MFVKRMFMLVTIMSVVFLFGCGQNGPTAQSNNQPRMLNTNDEADQAHMIQQNEEIANEITKIQGIKSSYVMLANEDAYVAVSLDQHEQNGSSNDFKNQTGNRNNSSSNFNDRAAGIGFVSNEMRAKIEKIVKKNTPAVKDIHISASPDFYNQMTGYIDDLNNGRAFNDVLNDINRSIHNMLPR